MKESRLTLPSVTGERFALTEEILRQGFEASRESPRKRIILPVHRGSEALVNRMLNFMQPGTYVQPHLHGQPGASETVQVLRGSLGFILFEPDGTVREIFRLEEGGTGLIDIEPGVWHGMLALAPDSVMLEIKRGPYDKDTDKEFASWAPAEGAAEADGYRRRLEALFGYSSPS